MGVRELRTNCAELRRIARRIARGAPVPIASSPKHESRPWLLGVVAHLPCPVVEKSWTELSLPERYLSRRTLPLPARCCCFHHR